MIVYPHLSALWHVQSLHAIRPLTQCVLDQQADFIEVQCAPGTLFCRGSEKLSAISMAESDYSSKLKPSRQFVLSF
jgi:hypothetical protein